MKHKLMQTSLIFQVIVSMSVAFAKQTELSGIAKQKEEEAPRQIVHPEKMHFGIKKQPSEEEIDSLLRKATGKGIKNEEGLKSLCKELSEESGEISSLGEQLHSNSSPDCILGQTTHESVISEELFSHNKCLTAEETPVSVKKTSKEKIKMKIPFKYFLFPFKELTTSDQNYLPFFPVCYA